jgi:peptidylprolyl isomerase
LVNFVPRRLRRLPALLLPLLLATTLVGCGGGSDKGSSSSSTSSGDALHGITITGDPGKEPTVKWNGKLDVSKTATTVVSAGTGDTIADGDQVSANIWIGDGYTQKKSYSTYDAGNRAETVKAGDSLSPVFKDAILGQKVGSRVAVTATAKDAFGASGNPQLGISNGDSILIIVDLMSKTQVLSGPKGQAQKAPSWSPKLVQSGDKVTGLDFKGTPKPDGKLSAATLIQGTGATVKKGQTITVNYLGQVYGAAKPFDESYSGDPASFAIGVGQVVSGWDKTLVGQKVGSRVMLKIPPAEGYGSQGNSQAGIKGTDTLYFVVDILSAS